MRGAGRAECGTRFMVRDLLDRRETHDGQLSFAAEIYIYRHPNDYSVISAGW